MKRVESNRPIKVGDLIGHRPLWRNQNLRGVVVDVEKRMIKDGVRVYAKVLWINPDEGRRARSVKENFTPEWNLATSLIIKSRS